LIIGRLFSKGLKIFSDKIQNPQLLIFHLYRLSTLSGRGRQQKRSSPAGINIFSPACNFNRTCLRNLCFSGFAGFFRFQLISSPHVQKQRATHPKNQMNFPFHYCHSMFLALRRSWPFDKPATPKTQKNAALH